VAFPRHPARLARQACCQAIIAGCFDPTFARNPVRPARRPAAEPRRKAEREDKNPHAPDRGHGMIRENSVLSAGFWSAAPGARPGAGLRRKPSAPRHGIVRALLSRHERRNRNGFLIFAAALHPGLPARFFEPVDARRADASESNAYTSPYPRFPMSPSLAPSRSPGRQPREFFPNLGARTQGSISPREFVANPAPTPFMARIICMLLHEAEPVDVRRAGKLAGIFGIIVQGRLRFVCPPATGLRALASSGARPEIRSSKAPPHAMIPAAHARHEAVADMASADYRIEIQENPSPKGNAADIDGYRCRRLKPNCTRW